MVGVRFPRSIQRPRQDDKLLTAEEAEEKIVHLTPEQRFRLRDVIEEKMYAREHAIRGKVCPAAYKQRWLAPYHF